MGFKARRRVIIVLLFSTCFTMLMVCNVMLPSNSLPDQNTELYYLQRARFSAVRTPAVLRQKQRHLSADQPTVPKIFVVTPTYQRHVQLAELTRLSQTFMHIPNLHWIVVEDAEVKSPLVTELLDNCKLNYTHLNIPTTDQNWWVHHRGVDQRNLALSWLRTYAVAEPGVVYFADDDNTYDIRIFDQMRYTKKVSVWPVAFAGRLLYEGPVVEKGRVVGWRSGFGWLRTFKIDMAGFAVNLQLIIENHDCTFDRGSRSGWLESTFLERLIDDVDELEPLADNCTQILVWHTRTEQPSVWMEGWV